MASVPDGWGFPIRAEAIDQKLATGEIDTITLIHSETSSGIMSPLAEIAALKKKRPDALLSGLETKQTLVIFRVG